MGEHETVIGGTYLDRAGDGIEFVVTREIPAHVLGMLSVPGKPTKEGVYRWGTFHELFELSETPGGEQ